MTEDKQKNSNSDIRSHYYRAELDAALLLVRSLVVLHSGALVAILISISRSEDTHLIGVLADACSYFWWGLLTNFVGMVLFTPLSPDFEELKPLWKEHGVKAILSGILILVSLVLLFVGTLQIINDIQQLYT